MNNVELTLYSENQDMLEAWADVFNEGMWETENVRIVESKLEHLDHQHCIIVPGNSYGIVGGVWANTFKAIFGEQPVEELKEALKGTILGHYLGEMPVGSAFTVNLSSDGGRLPDMLVYSGFFRVPTNRTLPDATYLCFLGALVEVNGHNHDAEESGSVLRVAVGGLGATMSKQDPVEAARQMKAAWDQFCNPSVPEVFTIAMDRNF